MQSCLNVGEIDQFELWLKFARPVKEVKIEIFTITLLNTVLKYQGNRLSWRLNLDLTFLSSIKMRETCLHVSKIGIDGLYKAGNYLNYLHFALDGTAPPMISIFISFPFFRSFSGIYSFKIKMSYFHLASQTIILLTT